MQIFQGWGGARWRVERWQRGQCHPQERQENSEVISPRTRRAKKLVTKLVLTDCWLGLAHSLNYANLLSVMVLLLLFIW